MQIGSDFNIGTLAAGTLMEFALDFQVQEGTDVAVTQVGQYYVPFVFIVMIQVKTVANTAVAGRYLNIKLQDQGLLFTCGV